eukprot:757535-Hanusia_phi.AAC.3
MPVDYSKWDKLAASDSDEEDDKRAAQNKRVVKEDEKIVQPKLSAPKVLLLERWSTPEASGSAWNASNYHWEEQKLDVWGKQRLKDVLKPKAFLAFHYNQTELTYEMNFEVDKISGDVWSHIRKGKSVLGYNLEFTLVVAGKVKTSSREEMLSATLECDLMVDHEEDPVVRFTAGDGLPFKDTVKKCILAEYHSRIGAFLKELEPMKGKARSKNRQRPKQQARSKRRQLSHTLVVECKLEGTIPRGCEFSRMVETRGMRTDPKYSRRSLARYDILPTQPAYSVTISRNKRRAAGAKQSPNTCAYSKYTTTAVMSSTTCTHESVSNRGSRCSLLTSSSARHS